MTAALKSHELAEPLARQSLRVQRMVRTPTTTPPTSPSEIGGRGTDKKKKCRVVAGFRIKPPKLEGDRWTVQARSRSGRWETQITTASQDFALEWVNSRSPNGRDQ